MGIPQEIEPTNKFTKIESKNLFPEEQLLKTITFDKIHYFDKPDKLGISIEKKYTNKSLPRSLTLAHGETLFAQIGVFVYPVRHQDGDENQLPAIAMLDCVKPTESLVIQQNKYNWPISLRENLKFNTTTNSFQNKDNSQIDLPKKIQELFEMHLSPCRPIYGFILRMEYRFHKLKQKMYIFFDSLCQLLLLLISGKKVSKPSTQSTLFK